MSQRITRLCTIASLSALTGCASVMNDSTHPLRIDTKTADGADVVGAACTVTNDYHPGVAAQSGAVMMVRRSAADLDIVCKQAGQPEAVGKAVSRPNAGMFGNIILGGVIGAVIDHSRGSAYTYPTWLVLIFGRTLVFDRSDDQSNGMPVVGRTPGAPKEVVQNKRETNEQLQRW